MMRKLLLAALALITVAAAYAGHKLSPRISWDPDPLVMETIAPGEEATYSVVLTNTGFRRISAKRGLRVVAEGDIAPYVTITQPAFPRVFRRGKQVTVELTVSVPDDAPEGFYDGELILKRVLHNGKLKKVRRAEPLLVSLEVKERTSIEVDTSPSDIELAPDETGNISTVTTFTTTASDSFTIAVTQQVVGPAGGISISPDVVGGFMSSTDHALVDNQVITALSNGVYEIRTTAEIVETGEIVSAVARVAVKSVSPTLFLGRPGSVPAGLAPDTSTSVVFATHFRGADTTTPVDVVLGGHVAIALNDDGTDGDIAANDGTFSGTTVVDTTGLIPGTCLSVIATAEQGSDSATSDTYDLCVSSLPLKTAPSDFANTVDDPTSGEPAAIADEALIGVVAGTPDHEIVAIAASVGGVVVGAIPGLNVYQIKLQAPVSSFSELAQILTDLEIFDQVSVAAPNGIGELLAVTPSDEHFGAQEALIKIRADEAWTIARGGTGTDDAPTIAVVDSGVDLDHPDLLSELVQGEGEYFPPCECSTDTPFCCPACSNDVDDEFGHGTHVAGIAAAATDNVDEGIAGVSWGSKILVVRVADCAGRLNANTILGGIDFARVHAKIINLSVGITDVAGETHNRDIICPAVTTAYNDNEVVVVAGAGNNGNDTEFYPAACEEAIAVGNTNLNDTRYTGSRASNYGTWVDMAAPGVNILSTELGGDYVTDTGTSMSAAHVSGAAAVLLSRQPGLTNAQVEQRLKDTAVKLPSEQLGAGRIDLFEAVFNGSFEQDDLALPTSLWKRIGTANTSVSLGPIVPQHGERMGYLSTGPAGTQHAVTLEQAFTIQPGVENFPISFQYAFVTEEYPEWVGTQYDDFLTIKLVTPDGDEILLAEESVNGSSFTAINGIDFPGGDETTGWTGWKTVSTTVPTTVPVTGGSGAYRIVVEDVGDHIFDTVTLIDDINFKELSP